MQHYKYFISSIPVTTVVTGPLIANHWTDDETLVKQYQKFNYNYSNLSYLLNALLNILMYSHDIALFTELEQELHSGMHMLSKIYQDFNIKTSCEK